MITETISETRIRKNCEKYEPSKAGMVPNFLIKGKVAAVAEGDLVGDCANTYDRMGELDGEGMVMRWLEPEMGVGRSVGELLDPDDEDETEAERLRGLMVIGGVRLGQDLSLGILFWKDIFWGIGVE